jgi:DNA-binding LacI/PurR family transcriptional regulator
MKKTTIKDVARIADVSPSTVSRVISDNPNISQETKDKVKKIMDEQNYYPNEIARSLVKQKTNTIGLVMSRPTDRAFANPFFSEIIRGIARIAKSRHYNLLISAAEDYYSEYEETVNLVKNSRVDGLILMASRVNDELLKSLQSLNKPFVLIGRSPEYKNIPRVDNDNIRSAYKMVNFLLEKNYKKISIISGPAEYIVSQDRIQGYKDALNEYNLAYDENMVHYTDFSYDVGYQTTEKILNSRQDVEIIFALDDLLAVSSVNCIKDNNLNIPNDIGVVGFNDQPISTYIEPDLTTVKIPILEMGRKATKMLIKMIDQTDYAGEKIIIPTDLVLRETH